LFVGSVEEMFLIMICVAIIVMIATGKMKQSITLTNGMNTPIVVICVDGQRALTVLVKKIERIHL
jgi:hypothetical protein